METQNAGGKKSSKCCCDHRAGEALMQVSVASHGLTERYLTLRDSYRSILTKEGQTEQCYYARRILKGKHLYLPVHISHPPAMPHQAEPLAPNTYMPNPAQNNHRYNYSEYYKLQGTTTIQYVFYQLVARGGSISLRRYLDLSAHRCRHVKFQKSCRTRVFSLFQNLYWQRARCSRTVPATKGGSSYFRNVYKSHWHEKNCKKSLSPNGALGKSF